MSNYSFVVEYDKENVNGYISFPPSTSNYNFSWPIKVSNGKTEKIIINADVNGITDIKFHLLKIASGSNNTSQTSNYYYNKAFEGKTESLSFDYCYFNVFDFSNVSNLKSITFSYTENEDDDNVRCMVAEGTIMKFPTSLESLDLSGLEFTTQPSFSNTCFNLRSITLPHNDTRTINEGDEIYPGLFATSSMTEGKINVFPKIEVEAAFKDPDSPWERYAKYMHLQNTYVESDGYIYVIAEEEYESMFENMYLIVEPNYIQGSRLESYEVPFENRICRLKPVNCYSKISFTAYPFYNGSYSLSGEITDVNGVTMNFTIPTKLKEFDKTFIITGTNIPEGSFIEFVSTTGFSINSLKHKDKKCYVDNNSSFIVNVNTPKSGNTDNLCFTARYVMCYTVTENHTDADSVTFVTIPYSIENTASTFDVIVAGTDDTYNVIATIGKKHYIATANENNYTFSDVVIDNYVKITISSKVESKVYVQATFFNVDGKKIDYLTLLENYVPNDTKTIYVGSDIELASNSLLEISNVSGCLFKYDYSISYVSKRFILAIDYITDEIITFTATLKYNTSA